METSNDIMESFPDREVVSTRTLNAPREFVYTAWADPEYLENWWGPKGFTNTFHKHELEPGGKWHFVMHGPEGGDYQNECVFIAVKDQELIAWDHISNPKFRAVATFSRVGKSRTRVVYRMIFETPAACQKIKSFVLEKNEENLDRLQEEVRNMMEYEL